MWPVTIFSTFSSSVECPARLLVIVLPSGPVRVCFLQKDVLKTSVSAAGSLIFSLLLWAIRFQTQAVTYIVQRLHLYRRCFIWFPFHVYQGKGFRTQTKKARYAFYEVSIISAVLLWGQKDCLTLPVIAVLMIHVFSGDIRSGCFTCFSASPCFGRCYYPFVPDVNSEWIKGSERIDELTR